MKNTGLVVLFLVAGLGFSFAKDKIKSPLVTVAELKQHVSYLASDALKGRKTGTEGDSLAAEYIRKILKADGLLPLYDKGFQRFRVTDKILNGPANSMMVNGTLLKLDTDFAPFAFSANDSFKGDVVFAGYGFSIDEDSLKWNDYSNVDVKGKVVMIIVLLCLFLFVKYSFLNT